MKNEKGRYRSCQYPLESPVDRRIHCLQATHVYLHLALSRNASSALLVVATLPLAKATRLCPSRELVRQSSSHSAHREELCVCVWVCVWVCGCVCICVGVGVMWDSDAEGKQPMVRSHFLSSSIAKSG